MTDLLINNKYIIRWRPKAGCTSIVKQWFNEIGILEEALKYSPWVHDFRQFVFYERFGKVTSNQLKSNDFIKIQYVRNPYDRAVSSYIHATVHPELINRENISFYEFVKGLHEESISINGGGRHWCRQSDPTVKFNEVIKIENIDKETKRLNEKYNLNLKNFSSSHHHKKLLKVKDFFLLKRDEVEIWKRKHKGIPSYKSFYNDEIKHMVYEVYKSDIESYKYEYPY